MKIEELIAELSSLKEEYGNIPVQIQLYDSGGYWADNISSVEITIGPMVLLT